jgi:hypothetical protein
MDPTLTPLITQLLAWVAAAPRTHAQAMDAWRTSCPRLPAWEEAIDHGLITCPGSGAAPVSLTQAGRAWLAENLTGCVRSPAAV